MTDFINLCASLRSLIQAVKIIHYEMGLSEGDSSSLYIKQASEQLDAAMGMSPKSKDGK